jgi:class 3 adenylate cyclase
VASEHGQRKIAAILAADVVGYSRLVGADEDRTLARLRALLSDLIDPTIAVHHGRVVKRTGDGSIIEFRSVVDAVRCAIEVQNGMTERNAGLPPERRIEFRIGIHLGAVVEEADGDLMGDGVNIAARLEGIAAPGAICLSEEAYWQVKGRLDLPVHDLGPIQLKNIAETIRVYSLSADPDNLDARIGSAGADVVEGSSILVADPRAALEAAEAKLTTALSSVPDHALGHIWLGLVDILTRRAAEGIANCEHALGLDRTAFARTPVLPEPAPVASLPPKCDGHRRDPQSLLYVDSRHPLDVSIAQIPVMSGRIWTPPDCNGFGKSWSQGHNC